MADNKKEDWYLGIDLGTGSCKSVVIDDRALVLGFGSSDYADIQTPTGWNELNPEELVEGMIRSVREAIDRANVAPQACRAISIGSALHSLIAIDQSGKPSTGLLTWIDARAVDQASAIRISEDAHQIYWKTGCPVHTMYPVYKIIWLRQKQPEIFQNASRFVSAKEYVLQRLTGKWLVDYNIAAGSGLLNAHELVWDPDMLRLAGVESSQLSQPESPGSVIHGLNSTLASRMGLSEDVPLVLGSSDAANSSLGAGAVLPDCATCMVGTSGAFRIIAPEPLLDPTGRCWCYAIDENHWLVGGAINNGGIVLSWFRDVLNHMISEESEESKLTFDKLVELAGQVDPGSGGLICLPFWAGERSPNWNMNTRGVFFGLTLNHDLKHMVRSLMEGVAFRLRSVAEVLDEMGCKIREIRVSGGLTRSDLWPRIIASSLDTELRIPQWGETSSLGAALWALLGGGVINNLEDIKDLVPVTRSYMPVPADAERYDDLFKLYKELYDALQKPFDEIAAFQAEITK